jgi:hypothetical protein
MMEEMWTVGDLGLISGAVSALEGLSKTAKYLRRDSRFEG